MNPSVPLPFRSSPARALSWSVPAIAAISSRAHCSTVGARPIVLSFFRLFDSRFSIAISLLYLGPANIGIYLGAISVSVDRQPESRADSGSARGRAGDSHFLWRVWPPFRNTAPLHCARVWGVLFAVCGESFVFFQPKDSPHRISTVYHQIGSHSLLFASAPRIYSTQSLVVCPFSEPGLGGELLPAGLLRWRCSRGEGKVEEQSLEIFAFY